MKKAYDTPKTSTLKVEDIITSSFDECDVHNSGCTGANVLGNQG